MHLHSLLLSGSKGRRAHVTSDTATASIPSHTLLPSHSESLPRQVCHCPHSYGQSRTYTRPVLTKYPLQSGNQGRPDPLPLYCHQGGPGFRTSLQRLLEIRPLHSGSPWEMLFGWILGLLGVPMWRKMVLKLARCYLEERQRKTILLATESLASASLSTDLWAGQRKCSLRGDYVLDSHTLIAATCRPLICQEPEGQRHSASCPGPQ